MEKLEFLDGLRGSLALWVLMHHIAMDFKMRNDYNYFHSTGYLIGVSGFFILSAFLLTYRLICQLESITFNLTKKSLNSIMIIILKYFIRRLFRIYFPFIIACSIFYSVPSNYNWNIITFRYSSTSWSGLIKLQSAGLTHFWTIAPECKYYIFIPLFCLIAVYINFKASIFANSVLIGFIYHYQVNQNNLDFILEKAYLFSVRFSTFYLGSLIAVFYRCIQRNRAINDYIIQNKYFQYIVCVLSFVLYLFGARKCSSMYSPQLQLQDFFRASLYWSFVFSIMLLGKKDNIFIEIFRNKFLCLVGKYSFGIYLFHPLCHEFILVHLKYYPPVIAQFEFLFYSFVFSFSAGFLFFHLIENRFIKLANIICNRF